MVEDPTLVRRQFLVARLLEPHPEDARAALLDVDDIPGREVDQGRGNGVVGHTESVREEVHDGRRLGSELQRPWTDGRLGRPAREEDGAGRSEPADGCDHRDERENEIRFAGQAEIVSAEADGQTG
jgi:hypothetical protein